MAVDLRQSRLKQIELFCYAAIVSWVALYSYRHPVYNWDLIGYVAAVAAIDHHGPQAIHRATFEELERSLPADRLQELKYGGAYRQSVFENPKYLVQQIPFYSAKPTYLALLYGLHIAGLSVPKASIWISIGSYLGICALIWRWAARRVGDPRLSFGLSSLLALAPPVALAAGLSTPDALSSLLVFAGLYLILELRFTVIGLCILFASIFVRTNNLIICVLVSVFIVSTRRSWPILARASAFTIACAVAVRLINSVTGSYGWRTLVYHTFIAPLPNPAEVQPDLTVGAYVRVLLSGLSSLHYSYAVAMLLFFIGGAIALRAVGYRLAWGPAAQGAALIVVSMSIHFLLFPIFWDRYLLGHYLAFIFISTRLFSEASLVGEVTDRSVPVLAPSDLSEVPSPKRLPAI
jgi:hypothetical protein